MASVTTSLLTVEESAPLSWARCSPIDEEICWTVSETIDICMASISPSMGEPSMTPMTFPKSAT